jgi:hypothetical protein
MPSLLLFSIIRLLAFSVLPHLNFRSTTFISDRCTGISRLIMQSAKVSITFTFLSRIFFLPTRPSDSYTLTMARHVEWLTFSLAATARSPFFFMHSWSMISSRNSSGIFRYLDRRVFLEGSFFASSNSYFSDIKTNLSNTPQSIKLSTSVFFIL